MGPATQLVVFLVVASFGATNGNFNHVIQQLYDKATGGGALLHGHHPGLRSGNAEEDFQVRNDNEDRDDDQYQHHRNQNRQNYHQKNRRPLSLNDLVVYINGGKGRSNSYNYDSQSENSYSSGLTKNKKKRVRYDHRHREHHRENRYDSQEADWQDQNRNQYDSQEADRYQNQNSQQDLLHSILNGLKESNRYQSARVHNQNRQSRHKQSRNQRIEYTGNQKSSRPRKHQNRNRQDKYWKGNREEQYGQENQYRPYRNNHRQKNRYDQRDSYDQRNKYDTYNHYVAKGIERQSDVLPQSPVVKSLLRISNDINCGAQQECKKECKVDQCFQDCEQKYVCNAALRVQPDPEGLESCENKECGDYSDDNPSTRGIQLEPEPNPCKQC